MISLLNHKWSKSVFSLINRFKPLSKSKAPDLRVSVSLLAAASFHMWRHVSVSVVVSVLSPSACWMMTACCCLTVCRLFVPAARRFLVFLSDCIVGAMELPSVCVGSAAVSAAAASTITLHCSSAFISFYEKLESSRTRTNVQIAAALSDGLKCDQLVPGTSRFRFCFVPHTFLRLDYFSVHPTRTQLLQVLFFLNVIHEDVSLHRCESCDTLSFQSKDLVWPSYSVQVKVSNMKVSDVKCI